MHADWGTDDLIWNIEGIDEFSCHKPDLVTEVVCQFMDSLRFVWRDVVYVPICPNVIPDPIERVKVAH